MQLNLPYNFVPGERNVIHSISEKQLYRRAKGNPNGKARRFDCIEPRCKAAVHLIDKRLTKLKPFTGHNHAKQEDFDPHTQLHSARSERLSEAVTEVLEE